MKKKIIIGVLIFLIAFIGFNVNTIYTMVMLQGEETTSFAVEGDKAVMTGVISKQTIAKVEKLIKEHPEVKTIVMQNVPGSIDDESNLVACRLVRAHGFNTHVPSDGMIASGGTDFFTAGVKRTVEEGAEIGVHSWAGDGVEDASKLPNDHEEHQKYLDYYKEMKIPQDFYWFTIKAAPASRIYNMTAKELIEYQLVTE